MSIIERVLSIDNKNTWSGIPYDFAYIIYEYIILYRPSYREFFLELLHIQIFAKNAWYKMNTPANSNDGYIIAHLFNLR